MLNKEQQDLLEQEIEEDIKSKLQSLFPQEEEELEEVEEISEPTPEDSIKDRLYSIPGAPTPDQIEAWKSNWGSEGVFVVSVAIEDTYVMRYLKTNEWQAIQAESRALSMQYQNNPEALAMVEEDIKKKVIKTCTLWPKVSNNHFDEKRAGLLDQLHYVVMMNSYFFAPQQALAFTAML